MVEQAIDEVPRCIPESMLAFVPAKTDTHIIGKTTGKTQRCIFAACDLDAEEQKHFEQMKSWAIEQGHQVPADFQTGERKLSRYL